MPQIPENEKAPNLFGASVAAQGGSIATYATNARRRKFHSGNLSL